MAIQKRTNTLITILGVTIFGILSYRAISSDTILTTYRILRSESPSEVSATISRALRNADTTAEASTSDQTITQTANPTLKPEEQYLLPYNACDTSHNFSEIFEAHQKMLPDTAKVITDLPVDAGYQPEIDCEFPTANNDPRIPHNIHQVWLSSPDVASVPSNFIDNVKSFLKHNPSWTYYFWTNVTVRALLQERYPSLLPVYDALPEIVMKGDMMRYVLIYEFGGLYADFDCMCHRPLDIAAVKYGCMLIAEPFEHAAFWYHKPFIVINAIMMCRAKHPFFKQLVEVIPSRKDEKNIVYKLGPGFLTEEYKKYSNMTKNPALIDLNQDTTSPYFNKGPIPVTHDDGIYIPNTRFFMDSPSPAIQGQWNNKCKSKEATFARGCSVIKRRGYFRKPGKFTFLEHQWTHTWSAAKKSAKYEYISIRNMTSNLGIFKPVNETV